MIESIRRYWIGILLIVMIGIHASIVGLTRYEASKVKLDASCEVDLGTYLGYQSGRPAPISMRLHAIVAPSQRIHSRHLIELNQAQVRQALEESLRQMDKRLLNDPYLTGLKTQLNDVLAQCLGSTTVDELVITEVHEPKDAVNLEFNANVESRPPRPVATLQHAAAANADAHAEEESSDHGSKEDSHGSSSHH